MREAARSQRPQQQPEHGCTETALRTCFSAPFAYPCGFGVFRVSCVPAVTTSVSSVFRCRTGVTPALDGKRQIGRNPEQWGSVVGAEPSLLLLHLPAAWHWLLAKPLHRSKDDRPSRYLTHHKHLTHLSNATQRWREPVLQPRQSTGWPCSPYQRGMPEAVMTRDSARWTSRTHRARHGPYLHAGPP